MNDLGFDVWGDVEIETPGLEIDAPELEIEIAEVVVPALEPKRYKALYGGRGGTKSDYVIAKAMDGVKCLCVREVQLSLDQSSKALIEERIDDHDLRSEFRILKSHIEHPLSGGRIEFKGMQQFNASNIKSLQGYGLAWWEEAHTASQYAIDLLIPTIRKDNSELIFTWNPEFPEDPVDAMFRGPNRVSEEDAVVIQVGSEDNPWLPEVLKRERDDLEGGMGMGWRLSHNLRRQRAQGLVPGRAVRA